MCKIKYPQKKYDEVILISGILFFFLFIAFRYYLKSNLSPGLAAATVFVIINAVVSLYKLRTYLLFIEKDLLRLDQGFFNKKLKLSLANITGFEKYRLNNKTIKIIFNLKNGETIKYSPPNPYSCELLESTFLMIKEKLALEIT